MTKKEYAVICKLIDKVEAESKLEGNDFNIEKLKTDLEILVDKSCPVQAIKSGEIIKR